MLKIISIGETYKMEHQITYTQATMKDLDGLAEMFDAYRQFYGQSTNLEAAKTFLSSRIVNKESIIFVAYKNEKAVGFVQMYPSFSSVSMKRLWILNDLFVQNEYRKLGIGTSLMKQAEIFARKDNAKGIVLNTQKTNETAQRVYRANGYKQDLEFLTFALTF